MQEITKILESDDLLAKKALFQFSHEDDDDAVLVKFNLWIRHNFSKYFSCEDAPFHETLDRNNLLAYRGKLEIFVDIVFRDGAKTSRTKLFVGFVLCNDTDHFRRYFKILAADINNSKQIVTDVYNMLVNPRIQAMYPELLEKTAAKREETMNSFTTATGVKVFSDSVGTDQRGSLQEEARPDFVWFEDFENRVTLRSLVKTKSIWDNMEEARTGLAKGGSCVYTCNYISEMGNVHRLVTKKSESKVVMIVPIIQKGILAWPAKHTLSDIEKMKANDDDFEGERLCKPSASKDAIFDRDVLERMEAKDPIRTVADFMMYRKYDPTHRYGSGHDVAGGVGLDSSTSVFIDFASVPAHVVGTFASNDIKPEAFGDEIHREGEYFSNPIAAIENNKFDQAVLRAKQLDVNLYLTTKPETKVGGSQQATFGWNTNQLTKPKMIMAFMKAVNDGHLQLNDAGLIQECKSYTRNDLIESVRDPRLTTRHFDLLIAACIAWQMKDHAQVSEGKQVFVQPAYHPGEFEGGHSSVSGVASITATPTGGRINQDQSQEYQQAPLSEYD